MTRWQRQMVNSVPAAALDAGARTQVGHLLRAHGAIQPPRLEAGSVVEFLRGGQLCCGFLRSTPMRREGVVVIDLQSAGNRRPGCAVSPTAGIHNQLHRRRKPSCRIWRPT